MTENAEKRVTKWGLGGEPYLSTKITEDSALSEKAGDSRHLNESNLEWKSLKTAGNRVRKWADVEANDTVISKDSSQRSSWDPVSGVKFERKDRVNRGLDEILQTTRTLDGDQSDSTSMSPVLDAWRQQSRSRSPKSGWSRACRSRSKSPSHGNKREAEGWNDRSRGRFSRLESYEYDGRTHDDGSPTDNGRGRHGNSWHSSCESFTESHEQRDYSRDKLSHGSNYDGDREKRDLQKNRSSACCNDFTRGKCYRGLACKFGHHDTSADGYGGWSMKEAATESSHDRGDMDQRHEPRRTSNLPCKYFAEGHCRSGERCRFSHQGCGPDYPEEKSRDKWGPSLDNDNRSWGGRKWSDKADDQDVPTLSHWSDQNGGKLGFPEGSCDNRWGHSLENENRSWGGRKWGEKAAIQGSPKSSQWGDDNGVKMSIPESGAAERSRDDKWGASLAKENRSWGGPTWGNKADGKDALNSSQRGNTNGAKMGVPESRAAVGSHDDKWGHNLYKGGPKWMDKAACRASKSIDNNDAKSLHDSWETGRSWDDKSGQYSHNENKSWGAPKWSDKAAGQGVPNSSQWKDNGGVKAGIKGSAKASRWGDDNSVKISIPESGAAEGSRDDKWGTSLDKENRSWGGPTWGNKADDQDALNSYKSGETNGAKMGVPESRATVGSHDDKWGHNLYKGGPKWMDKATCRDVSSSKSIDNNDAKGGPHDSWETGRSWDEKSGQYSHNENKSWGAPKWSGKAAGQGVPNSSQWKDDGGVKAGIKGSPKASRWGGDNSAKISMTESGAAEGSRDDTWGTSLDKENRSWGSPTWGNKADGQDALNSSQRGETNGAKMGVPESRAIVVSHDDKWGHKFDKGGPKWMDKAVCRDVAISSKNIDNNDAKSGINDSWETGRSWDDKSGHCSRTGSKSWGAPKWSDKATGQGVPISSQWKDSGGAKTGFTKSRATEKLLDVTGKPSTQNVGEQNLDFVNDTESEHDLQDFQSKNPKKGPEENTNRVLASQGQNMIQSVSVLQRPPVSPVLMQPETLDAKISHTASGEMTQNVVTSDQVAQMTNLSASLAQIFGNGQQLPQPYTSLVPTDSIGQVVPSQSNSASLIPMGSVPNQRHQGSLSQINHHLIRDSMEPSIPDDSDPPPGFSSISVEHKSTAIEESQTPLKSLALSSVSGGHNIVSEGKSSDENPRIKPFDLNKVTEADEEGGNGQSKKEEEAGHSEDMDVDNRVDKESMRGKDEKGMRMFKFALVEFIKEILKPSWKEGQVSREAHRTIVKKVVDKVTGTIQGPHIPQTEQTINQYLSHSKPKLTKLVQAYVERYVKT